jgi:ketosteroid isomerase-like protein
MTWVDGMVPSGLQLLDMFAVIDGRCWERLRLHFAPDVVYERPGYQSICGIAALEHFYRNVRIIESGRHTLTHVVLTEHVAACWGRFRGTARDGRELDERFADAYELRGGLILRRETYFFRAAI